MKNYKNLLHIMSKTSMNYIECDEDIEDQILTLIKFYPEIIRESKQEYKESFKDDNWNWLLANKLTHFIEIDNDYKEEDIYNTFKENVWGLIEENTHNDLLIDFELKKNKSNPYYLKINNGPKNTYAINDIESENNIKFSKGHWIFVLFNQKQRGIIFNMLDIVEKYPRLNFAFKPYINNSKIQFFSNVIKGNNSETLLYRNTKKTIFLTSKIIRTDKLEEVIDEINLKVNNCFSDDKVLIKPKIILRGISELENYFTLRIENAPQNVFAIDSIESEENKMFSKGNWIFILFAGYSGPDIKLVYELMEVVGEYPNLNFAFKPYMDDDKMQTFTSVNIHRKVPPVILHKNENKTTLVCNRLKSKEKIKELLNKI